MEPHTSTPLLEPDESVNCGLNSEDEVSSDCSNSTDNQHKSRRSRLPFHYPHVHKSARMRREAGSQGIATYHRYKYYSRLADPTIDTLSIPDHVVPHTFLIPFSSILTGKQGSTITIFNIWNTMMGSSLLSIPWAIQEAGFAAGLIILFIMGGLCFYTAYRIVSLRSLAELPSSAVEFPDLCRLLLGPWAELIATFFSLIPLLGGAIVYWVLLSNFLYFIGVYIHSMDHAYHINLNISNADNTSFPDVYCPDAVPVNETSNIFHNGIDTSDMFYKYWNMELPIPLYIAVLFFPFVSLKSPTFFTKLNALGTLAVLFLITFVIRKAALWGINFNTFDLSSINYVHLFKTTFPVLIGTLSLSFFIHNCILSLLRNQKKPENNARDLAIAYVLVGTTYLIVGGVFFATFPLQKDCLADNLLNNFTSDDGWALAARFFLLFQVFSLYPLVVYILRVQIMHFFYGTPYPNWWLVMILNVVILIICILFNIYVPRVGTIIRYCGAISALAFVFTLPCVTYMKALHEKKQLTTLNAAIHICIIILGVCNFISQFLMHTK